LKLVVRSQLDTKPSSAVTNRPTSVPNINAYEFTLAICFQSTEDHKAGVTIGDTGFHNGLRLQGSDETVERERAPFLDGPADWIRKL
jgi:hypothetical protein